jgi:hypothetical protein
MLPPLDGTHTISITRRLPRAARLDEHAGPWPPAASNATAPGAMERQQLSPYLRHLRCHTTCKYAC